jgi:hypothetical protein
MEWLYTLQGCGFDPDEIFKKDWFYLCCYYGNINVAKQILELQDGKYKTKIYCSEGFLKAYYCNGDYEMIDWLVSLIPSFKELVGNDSRTKSEKSPQFIHKYRKYPIIYKNCARCQTLESTCAVDECDCAYCIDCAKKYFPYEDKCYYCSQHVGTVIMYHDNKN